MQSTEDLDGATGLHDAFIRRPYLTAFAITVAGVLLTGGGRALLGLAVPDGPHHDAITAGLQQTVLALAVLALAVLVVVSRAVGSGSAASARDPVPHRRGGRG